jgi:glyoxylase-like metal-dependent hydrolase (beta-lactamase superfamily II)
MNKQIPLPESAIAPDQGELDRSVEVTDDVACQRIAIVNVVFYGRAGADEWVLIDAGITGSAGAIMKAAAERYGRDARPAAILLTHAHFDHVGALDTLIEKWKVPVYAHSLEWPYLDGTQSYPPPDPSVGGGIMARLSPLYPRGPINVGSSLVAFPESQAVPFMPGWEWIHTPGHTPGHASFWRESDRTLIVGDAFITTRQESAYAVIKQEPEMHGPPKYYTPDWEMARASVQRLAALEPERVVTGHGRPMQGPAMREALRTLARDFDRIARP